MTVKPLEECLEDVNNILEDLEYKLKRARSPRQKRINEKTMEFWQSIKAHLESLDKLNESTRQAQCK